MCFITSVPEPIPIIYPYEIWYKIEGRRKGYNEILDLIFFYLTRFSFLFLNTIQYNVPTPNPIYQYFSICKPPPFYLSLVILTLEL